MQLRSGDMVRDGRRLMKICDISNDVADCIWFDSRGQVHQRMCDVEQLSPFWLLSSPKSTWPDINDVPEKPKATIAEKLAQAKAKATKPKLSKKIRREAT